RLLLFQSKQGYPEKKYENRSGGGFVSGIYEVSSNVLSERARRFGVTDAPKSAPTPEAIAKLYKSLDVTDEDFTRGRYRLDALYMRGTEELSTKDIFEYFQAYAPSNIEWISDNSCNVVWLDAAGPVRALIGLSCPILPREADLKKNRHTLRSKNGRKGSVRAEDVAIPVPPGRWRLGVPCSRTKAILLRFSGRKDRKPDGAERKSQYYRKYGNPNFGGIKGFLSESGRKRMREAQRRREVEEGQRWGRDDKNIEEGPKNPWGALASNWGHKESQEDDRFDYQALLRQHQKRAPGMKRKRAGSDYEDEDMMDDEEDFDDFGDGSNDDHYSKNQGSDDSDDIVPWKSKIKIPRMKMYADAEQKKKKRKKSDDLWHRLSGGGFRTTGGVQDRLSDMRTPKGRSIKSRLDLRTKLSSKRKIGPMSVEVDNAHYYSLIASDDD
ncbi:Nuclear cap-binding protein subunit 3-like, partial [Homarus americanus]